MSRGPSAPRLNRWARASSESPSWIVYSKGSEGVGVTVMVGVSVMVAVRVGVDVFVAVAVTVEVGVSVDGGADGIAHRRHPVEPGADCP